MKQTFYQRYLQKTTKQGRNHNPRLDGIMETISNIIENPDSKKNLNEALAPLHEYHRQIISRSKVKDEEELERVATMMTMSLYLCIDSKM